MKIILQQAQGEITEKKSRFIATLCPVQSQEEAEQFIAACKKKCWDARHHCSAYVIGENNEIMHSSDDGEPSGTAGRPFPGGFSHSRYGIWRKSTVPCAGTGGGRGRSDQIADRKNKRKNRDYKRRTEK